ncbi:retropepsin-like aspartic protease family protein [Neptunomonas japonica]|uniref:Aspartyl protease family protein n=1 Tax=Neptunomonas japonica JAMM 1380 TaxID=1441457 RepID=A0A7R6PPP8_9GAMM|nr:TIGR02281 family clan AA aspartic protease [Neptunomonas japonica]BBB30327.1 aspartyl protease family protein [Neptunomonas japonica JAMM 1380]
MRYLTWLIALALLTMLFNNWLDKQQNPNAALASVNVDIDTPVILKRNRQGHYIASGLVNEQPVVFLLDTGATVISIPENIAAQMGLKKGPEVQVGTANGSIKVYSTLLDSVQLGHIVLKNVRGHINPYMNGQTALLGMSFLKHLELQQSGDTLKLNIPN